MPRSAYLALLALLVSAVPAAAQKPDLTKTRPCGPDAITGPLRYLIPQGFLGADFRPACERHDRCYENPCRTQAECDAALHQRLLCACEKSRWPAGCRAVAHIMYGSVRLFGARARAAYFRRAALSP